MTTSLIVEILLGVLAAAVGAGSFLGASRVGRLQAAGVKATIEADAYGRAKEIYESAIKSLEGQLTRLGTEIRELDLEVVKLRESNRLLSGQVTELQDANRHLLAEMSRNRRPR